MPFGTISSFAHQLNNHDHFNNQQNSDRNLFAHGVFKKEYIVSILCCPRLVKCLVAGPIHHAMKVKTRNNLNSICNTKITTTLKVTPTLTYN